MLSFSSQRALRREATSEDAENGHFLVKLSCDMSFALNLIVGMWHGKETASDIFNRHFKLNLFSVLS